MSRPRLAGRALDAAGLPPTLFPRALVSYLRRLRP